MKKVFAFLSIMFMAVLLGVNVYTSVVDAKSWGASIPDSIVTARNYFKTVNPGTFFRAASPINQLIALVTAIACWKSGKRARFYFGVAFLLAVLTDVLTFTYFYPRNAILFTGAEANVKVLTKTWSEWSSMNWVKSTMIAVGLVCSMKGLDCLYRENVRS